MKKKSKYLLSSGVVLALLIIIFQTYIWNIGVIDKDDNADAVIVLGCSVYGSTASPFLEKRTLLGEEIYKNGQAKKIIVSGGKGSGENISEAECMKNILISKGVKEEDIILEDKSTSTDENIRFSKEKMKENNLNTAIVVSNKFHLRRAQILCNRYDVEAKYDGVFLDNYKGDEIYGGIREMAGIIKDLLNIW